MKVRNITNKEVVNIENCEDEPIHIPGLIQPHGFLISVDATSKKINVCSENINDYIPLTHQELLSKNIERVFSDDFYSKFLSFSENNQITSRHFNSILYESLYSVTFHKSGNNIIIEAEPAEQEENENEKLYNSSRKLLNHIEDTSTLKELCDSVAVAIKDITGYDRVMVYKFDDEYNGEVLSESREEHLEPYLGLHYPHTDIPKQARDLYIKNQLRVIGDVNYTPAELYTLENSNIEQLDLSLSVLRSVSPIHIEYLKNMGVGATLALSLLHKDKLWGLIVCHNYSAKHISEEIKDAVKLHGHFITSQIDVRVLNENYKTAIKASDNVKQLTSKKLDFNREAIKKLFTEDAVIKLSNSCGVAAVVDGDMYSYGKIPNAQEVFMLGIFSESKTNTGNFVTDQLPKITDNFKTISKKFPGISYYSLGDDKNFIIWFREPSLTEISWAGNPEKSIVKNEKGLSPRKSFEKFTKNVEDKSFPWLNEELSACASFVNFFQSFIRSIITNEEKEKQKKLTEILRETNEELENINWISTHDLKEPLRKIRMTASTLLRDEKKKELTDFVISRVERMENSAQRMQTLISDILKYTKTNAEHIELEEVDLNNLIYNIKQESSSILEDGNVKITFENLPTIKGIPFLLKQLFLNIMYNSIKFQIPEKGCKITIRENSDNVEFNKLNQYNVIEVVDNGIGFDNEYKEKIFKIFSRLHSKSDYEGSGIGLALCKKIMTKHNGYIEANGEINKGATIRLYFPKN